jgi:hypothetical protein
MDADDRVPVEVFLSPRLQPAALAQDGEGALDMPPR